MTGKPAVRGMPAEENKQVVLMSPGLEKGRK